MNSLSTKVQMSYTCNQKWNKMDVTAAGRFCAQCNHEVIDLTKNTFAEISRLKNENKELCGRFNDAQIAEFELKERSNFLKKAIAITSTLIVLHASEGIAQQQDSIKTEQNSFKSELETKPTASEAHDSISTCNHEVHKTDFKKRKKTAKLFSIGEYNIFFIKRFPLLSIRKKRILMGKFSL